MKIKSEVIEILEQCTIDGNELYLPCVQLDRKLYMDVDKVLKMAGGKWARVAKAHVFTEDIGDTLDTLILTGEITDIKKELQYFPTPKSLVELLINIAQPNPGEQVLEPSAGEGNIAKELIRIGCKVDTCEIHEPFRQTLIDIGCRVYMGDFLKFDSFGSRYYKTVVANPPFTRQQDIDHVNHMMDLCYGRVVSVMSASVRFRENAKTVAFRERIESLGGQFMDLPSGTFKSSGTMVSACIVVVDGEKP